MRRMEVTVSDTENKMPEGAPSLEEILVQSNDMDWRAKSLKGVHEKMLWRDDETGIRSFLCGRTQSISSLPFF